MPSPWHQPVLSAAKRRAQFCANPRFHPRDGAPGCEKFLALLQVRCAGVGECIAVHDHLTVRPSASALYMTQSAYFKCFFFAVRAQLMAATMCDAVFAGARGGTSAGAGRAPGTRRM
jgi:hypothetical protein